MIKGRIAETLIEQLYLAQGFKVFRYGMENTIPGIMDLLKGFNSDVAREIRSMPDLVVRHPVSERVFFVEVKFRKSGVFTINDLPKDFPYQNAYFIIVSKKHIKCITYQELAEGKSISPASRYYLGRRDEFGLDKEVIKEYCEFAIHFFDRT
ncbi:MAG: hypothetical protein HWD84_10555 [Flavobacteriaceae bacterium]|nr:hypothetical protein [Flavobacteriaceae bacterium]